MNTTTKATNFRWVICSLLFFATTINYLDRQILSFCKPMLQKDLGIDDAQFGIINSVFQAAYGFGMLGFGWFVDRYGTKVGYATSIIWWSLAAMAHWFISGFTSFVIIRFLFGMGESGNFPTAIKATALWFPKKERAFATSLFNAGSNISGVIAPYVIYRVAELYGWRGAQMAAGLLGFIWLVAWLVLYKLPAKHPQVNEEELAHIQSDGQDAPIEHKIPWSSLLAYRQTWSFLVAKFFTDPAWWSFLIWLPGYFADDRGLDLKKSMLHLITIYSLCTVFSILVGWLTGQFIQRGWTPVKARKVGMLIPALVVTPLVFTTHVGDWTAVFILGFAMAAHQAWSANLFTTVSDMFPKRAIASVVSMGSVAGSISGFLFPWFCGWLLTYYKTHGDVGGKGAYTIIFCTCACAYLTAFFLNHLLAPKFAPVNFDTTEPDDVKV